MGAHVRICVEYCAHWRILLCLPLLYVGLFSLLYLHGSVLICGSVFPLRGSLLVSFASLYGTCIFLLVRLDSFALMSGLDVQCRVSCVLFLCGTKNIHLFWLVLVCDTHSPVFVWFSMCCSYSVTSLYFLTGFPCFIYCSL